MKAETFRTWWKLFMQRWDRAEQKELTAFYWNELKDMPDEVFGEAARKALRGSTYFPTVEELEASVGMQGLTGFEAWELLLPCLYGRSSAELLPTVKRVVSMMGGLSSIGAREADLPHRRREFMTLYTEIKVAEKQKELTGG